MPHRHTGSIYPALRALVAMKRPKSSRSSRNRLLLCLLLSTAMLGNAAIASLVHCPAMMLSALQNGECGMAMSGVHHKDESPESSCTWCQHCAPTSAPGLVDSRATINDGIRTADAILPAHAINADYQRPAYSLYVLRAPPA